MGFGSPFGGGEASFDEQGSFVPEHLPEPGVYLREHDVLTGEAHVAFHQLTRTLFEERGVYDVTFDYNLAELNLDRRHEDAGFRYAEETESGLKTENADLVGGADFGEGADLTEDVDFGESEDFGEDADLAEDADFTENSPEGTAETAPAADQRVLRAEFTPTTEFCPQTDTLTKGAFRAWNGLSERHDYDLVKVRVAPMHHESRAVNERLRELEETFRESGELGGAAYGSTGDSADGSASVSESSVADGESDGSLDTPF
jgi:hypothetical protein